MGAGTAAVRSWLSVRRRKLRSVSGPIRGSIESECCPDAAGAGAGKTLLPAGRSWTGPYGKSQYQVLRRGAQCAPVIRASVRNGCWKSHIACGMGRRFQWLGESRGKAASCGPASFAEAHSVRPSVPAMFCRAGILSACMQGGGLPPPLFPVWALLRRSVCRGGCQPPAVLWLRPAVPVSAQCPSSSPRRKPWTKLRKLLVSSR